jgi:hypothetical protein
MKTLSIIAIAGLASAAAADAQLTANPNYAGHNQGPRDNYASATMTVAVDYDHWDLDGDSNNVVVMLDLNAALGGLAGQDAFVTGIGWDTTIMAFSPSWLSESSYDFAGQIFLSPGAGDDISGTASYSSGGILDLGDDAGFEYACQQGADLGFDGKTLIHPKQVAPCNKVFTPPLDDVDWSRKIIAAHAAAASRGEGVAVVDGKLIENLHVESAKRLVVMAEAIEKMESANAA